MSKLYGSIESDSRKTPATSRGHKSITAHIRGWDEGVKVDVGLNASGKVVCSVYRTGGSNAGRSQVFVAEWIEGEKEVYRPCDDRGAVGGN